MAVLDLQRRGQQIGRIRIGQQVRTSSGKMRPARLDTFRFTTGSRASADAIAALYGGQVRDWGAGEYEVITGQSAIGVTVPPRDQIVSQWYEMWTAGGCQRRCDSQHEQISGGACLCPAAEERSRLASLNPPQACKLVTRISVMLPDLPGLGVWRLDTGSYYAAVEIGDSGELMQMARERGVFLPAVLRIEQRQRVADGQTKKFPVPVLEVTATFRDLATGAIEAAGITAQLPPPPGGERRAITSGTPAREPAPAAPAQPAPQQQRLSAQQIADLVPTATTRRDLAVLAKQAKELGYGDDLVCTDYDNDVWEPLSEYVNSCWSGLPAAEEHAG